MRVSQATPRVPYTATGSAANAVPENYPWEIDGRLVCNNGNKPVYIGVGEAPTTTAYEYCVDPQVTIAVEAASGVPLFAISADGTSVPLSFKGYRS